MVATATMHSIALSADGKVFGWGDDRYGQLGQGRPVFATVPQVVPGLNLGQDSTRLRVAAGGGHDVTVKSDGSVWAWGNASAKWSFYAPSLEAQGGTALAGYVANKGYLNFATAGKKLGNGAGFWVNR